MPSTQTLVTFDYGDGASPYGSLIADAAGNLYGTTKAGGANGLGTVFEITRDPTTGAYSTTPTTLVSFNAADGALPVSSLYADASGNLYGTTQSGGANNLGTVFEITRNLTTGAYNSTPDTLVSFAGANGAMPSGNLIADAAGNLYGTTPVGGANNDGTLFEITRNSATGTLSSAPTTLVSFSGSDGVGPAPGLLADAAGNLYGTTALGGANNNGTVFEITRNPVTGIYSNTPTTLASFPSASRPNGGGSFSSSGLIADAAGDLFGTRSGINDGSSIFEIVRDPTTGAYNSTPKTLASFPGVLTGGVIADAAGNLYGTYVLTKVGGTVFELARDPTTGAYSTTTLAAFVGAKDPLPYAGLIADKAGNLYGTTIGDPGSTGYGTVFEITDTGFVTCFASGTRIRVAQVDAMVDVAVEALAVGDLVITASGAARPIRWLGHRRMDCRRHPRPHDAQPIRIAAHAFGACQPAHDLWLSPGHLVLVGADADHEGGHLVPIMCLINGTTVRRVAVESVTYWHVELDTHDILLAEGLPAESYLDWGDRAFFTEGSEHALQNPDFVVPGLDGRCRPVAIDGPIVEAARGKLDMIFAIRLSNACAWPDAEHDTPAF